MAKDTSQGEVMSNSVKLKLVALAVVELHLLEGISQVVSQLGRQSVSKNSVNHLLTAKLLPTAGRIANFHHASLTIHKSTL